MWWGPCESKDELLRDAELYNRAGPRMAAEGIKLCYHNHAHEFKTAWNGVCAMDILAEYTDPKAVYFEMDIAWITMGGVDPVHVLNKMAGRVPAIHVKDVLTAEEPDQWTAVGTGIVRIAPSILKAREIGVEWMVVEQDRRELVAVRNDHGQLFEFERSEAAGRLNVNEERESVCPEGQTLFVCLESGTVRPHKSLYPGPRYVYDGSKISALPARGDEWRAIQSGGCAEQRRRDAALVMACGSFGTDAR